jgi:putative glycosyltransferase
MKVSIVTTLYYSEKFLPEFYAQTRNALTKITDDYEMIFVDDGSPDNSASYILGLQNEDPRVVLIELSRNFGHHQAIITGLQHARGEYVFLIDCDLEEDPKLLKEFWDTLNVRPEVDVVYGIQEKRKGGIFERTSGAMFYKLLNRVTNIKYPANTLTARLMKRKYVDAVLRYTEKTLDIWTVFILVGFKQEGFIATKKSKGSSTYTLTRKLSRGIEIITSVSHRPLYLIFFIGLIWLFISTVSICIILIKKFIYGNQIEGWASIMASVWLIGGVIIFLLGVIAIYLSKMFLEVKNRPVSITKTVYRKN